METWACPHCDRLFDLYDLCREHAALCDQVLAMRVPGNYLYNEYPETQGYPQGKGK